MTIRATTSARPGPASAPAAAPAAAPASRGRPALTDRARLLDAAEDAIRELGPGVSLDQVAARAGVTKPVLFMHVGDRRALVVALAARLLERISATVEEALDGANGGRGMVRALVRAQLITVAAHPNLLAFVTGTRAGEGANPATLEFGMRAAASLVPGLALARERAGLDPSVADTWAHAIVGTLHMVSLWWLFGPGPRKPVDQLADELTGLLWAGLGGT